MCVGIPMKVLEPRGRSARCAGRHGSGLIDLSLVGPQPAGTWVLTFMGYAKAVLDAEEAARTEDALEAVDRALRGESFDHLFADLIGREPELPKHLRDEATGGSKIER